MLTYWLPHATVQVTEFAGYRLLYNIYTRNADEQMAALTELNDPVACLHGFERCLRG
eukprot:m.566711 g.566711  ORF g.566711 m.566711 type:complete len:57 (+) comp22253_c0_seq16:1609-1779(+)